jgi:hypothetical protein
MAEPMIEIPVRVSEEEFVAWSRRALQTKSELPAWVRTVVNHALAAPTPRKPRPTARTGSALHWLDDEHAYACDYCGFDLDYTATRRKRFCSDVCRVRAWRVRKRLGAPEVTG